MESGPKPVSKDFMKAIEFFLNWEPNIADSSPEEIEAKANASVQKALGYFRECGIELGYTPRVKYTGKTMEMHPTGLASVDGGEEFYLNVISFIGAANAIRWDNKRFGLKLSDEAVEESAEIAKKEMKEILSNGLYEDDADIFLYEPIRSELHDLDEIMVHEVWHLIEKEKGVLDDKFIHEGTATYVENRFAERESEWVGNEADYYGVIYKNVAHIVQEIVKDKPNPLQAILSPEIRVQIQKQFEERVKPLFMEKLYELVDSTGPSDKYKEFILTHPGYESFRRNPNKENLLKGLRQRGYVKTAEELSRQDMTKILEYYKSFLEG